MKKYKRLSFKEREEISRCLAKGLSQRQIAKQLKRSPSTINREIYKTARRIGHYRCVVAHGRAKKISRHPKKPRKLIKNQRLRSYVFEHLKYLWSPKQIVKTIAIEYPDDMDMRISHETIYSYLYVRPRGTLKKMLAQCLRHSHGYRYKQGTQRRNNFIKNITSIEQRPDEVDQRHIPGHWEGDLIIGTQKGAVLGTLVERTTRMVFMMKIKSRDARTVRRRFTEVFKKLPKELAKTLTYDQGREMAQHELFTKNTSVKVYFAHPHSPWERGTNENTNGLIRQFFPKGIEFNNVSTWKIKRAQDLLNSRPRETLNWQSPQRVFAKLLH